MKPCLWLALPSGTRLLDSTGNYTMEIVFNKRKNSNKEKIPFAEPREKKKGSIKM